MTHCFFGDALLFMGFSSFHFGSMKIKELFFFSFSLLKILAVRKKAEDRKEIAFLFSHLFALCAD